MRRWLMAGVAALAVGLALTRGSEAGPGPTVTIDASSSISGVQSVDSVFLTSGSTTVDILVGSISDLRAFNFEVVYDQTKLSAPTISTGSDLDRNPNANQSFLTSSGRTWSCSPPAPSGDTDASATVGVAFISCFSSGAPAGPNASSGGDLIASLQFNTVALGTSALTLRTVNTFKAGSVETASCNPVVIISATCTEATINVTQQSVGGMTELPHIVPVKPHLAVGPLGQFVVGGAIWSCAIALLLFGLVARRRRRHG